MAKDEKLGTELVKIVQKRVRLISFGKEIRVFNCLCEQTSVESTAVCKIEANEDLTRKRKLCCNYLKRRIVEKFVSEGTMCTLFLLVICNARGFPLLFTQFKFAN